MNVTLVLVAGVVSLVAVAAFSDRLGLAAPLSLVVIGAGLGFVPDIPDLHVEPDWVLAGVLPPLLYSAAVNMPANDFRRNFKPIFGLAVVLVVVTTLATGALLHMLVPGLSWPVAFAVGAVISPTDAVAATSMGRRLGLPSRLLTVLEGEGLVNDATALVLLRSAIAATAGAVSLWSVAGEFVYSVAVATVIGFTVAHLGVRVRARLNDPVLNTATSFVVPFVAFLPAEELGASGVLAVVVTGVVTGFLGPRHLRAVDRLAEAANWRTVAFLLESGIFLFMGLVLHPLVEDVDAAHVSVGQSVLLGLAATLVVIVLRLAYVAPLVGGMRRDERRRTFRLERAKEWLADDEAPAWRRGRRERFEQRVAQASADVRLLSGHRLGRRAGLVLGWSGMRGAITVAAAMTLPPATPHRPQLILIAFVVAATTLLVQGLSLPGVIRAAKVPGDDPAQLRAEYADLVQELSESGRRVLDAARDAPAPVLDKVRADSLIQDPPPEDRPRLEDARQTYIDLRKEVLSAQRATLIANRTNGLYSSEALDHAQHTLDREEITLDQLLPDA
ncbi:cation:proton antiporter [Actinomadura flavalba]|uniref:cation:proton antiporter n=1 Tax=Actinomadura flavalba TaxID=1120938 RepID=UPI00047674E1|nr:cation:proton antiporter [Actinomadura flavalba]